MADDFEAMLSTIGEKFDMSFDEAEEAPSLTQDEQHQESINPENRIGNLPVEMRQDSPHKQEPTTDSK